MSKAMTEEHSAAGPSTYQELAYTNQSSDSTGRTTDWLPIYEPLPQGNYFRILVLHPGQYDDPIKCELEVRTRRRAKNKYAAISYTWEDGDRVDVTCNNFTFSIAKNLGQALRQFRHPRTIRRLWADAICINQENSVEKNSQVKSMGKVFRNAMKVLVWLGDDPEHLAVDCFNMIEIVNDYLDDLFKRHQETYSQMPGLRQPHPIPEDRESWGRVQKLLDCRWFHRTWTIQECALARECRMFWGSEQIDIAEVYEMSLWCTKYVDLNMMLYSHGFSGFDILLSDFQSIHCYYGDTPRWQDSKPGLVCETKEWSKSSFSRVLFAGGSFRCSLDCDRVFAFLECPLGQTAAKTSLVEVDYLLPKEELWHRVACTLIEHPGEGPWLLSTVKHEERDVLSKVCRPSWVPYWETKTGQGVMADRKKTYCAGGPLHHFAASPGRGKTLQLRGFIFDSVIWKSATFGPKDFILHQYQNRESPLSEEPFIDILWRETSIAVEARGHKLHEDTFSLTLRASGRESESEFEEHRQQFKAYCTVARTGLGKITSTDVQVAIDEEMKKNANAVMDDMNWFTNRRCLFLTRDGRLGLGYGKLVEVDDLCCVFSGAPVPFLLTPAGDRWHKLVDECYIYGVMHGQLVDEYKPGPIFLK